MDSMSKSVYPEKASIPDTDFEDSVYPINFLSDFNQVLVLPRIIFCDRLFRQ